MTTSTNTGEEIADKVRAAGKAWRKAATTEQRLRAERDEAIVAAAQAQLGVREIARLAQVDPTQVSRVLNR